MNANDSLVQAILSSLSLQTLHSLSAATGEIENTVKSALTTAVPVVIGALIGQIETPSSAATSPLQGVIPASGLSKLLISVSQLSSAYGYPTGKTGTSLDALVEDPSPLLREIQVVGTPASSIVPQLITQLFGTQADQTVRILSNLCGLQSSSMTSIVAVAVPLVFSRLSKFISNAGLSFDVSSLSSTLTTFAPQISKTLPSGLASMLSLGSVVTSVASSAPLSSANSAAGNSTVRSEAFIPATRKTRDFHYAPLLTLLVVVGGAWYFWNSTMIRSELIRSEVNRQSTLARSSDLSTTENLAQQPNESSPALLDVQDLPTKELEAKFPDKAAPLDRPTTEGEQGRAMLGPISNAGISPEQSDKTPVLTTLTLPNGTSVASEAGKIESQLLTALSGASPSTNSATWYNFDRLNFETGSAALSANSQEQIQNIALILKAYPTARIKIGGYTDSSGDLALNLALSERRAQAVKIAVAQLGVTEGRIEAEGYGSAHPLASEDTAEGKAINRRIALRLLEK